HSPEPRASLMTGGTLIKQTPLRLPVAGSKLSDTPWRILGGHMGCLSGWSAAFSHIALAVPRRNGLVSQSEDPALALDHRRGTGSSTASPPDPPPPLPPDLPRPPAIALLIG